MVKSGEIEATTQLARAALVSLFVALVFPNTCDTEGSDDGGSHGGSGGDSGDFLFFFFSNTLMSAKPFYHFEVLHLMYFHQNHYIFFLLASHFYPGHVASPQIRWHSPRLCDSCQKQYC